MAKGVDPPPQYYRHRYRVTNVPEGCTDFTEGDYVWLYVTGNPDQNAVMNPGGPCDGVTVTLDDPP
jgi:hypothetical protein